MTAEVTAPPPVTVATTAAPVVSAVAGGGFPAVAPAISCHIERALAHLVNLVPDGHPAG